MMRLPRFDPLRPAVVALAVAVALLAACQRNAQGPGAIGTFGAKPADATAPAADSGLQPTVVTALATRRITTSTQEDKVAAPGNQFIVLDVGVRNADAQPHVFSEGKLVAVGTRGERSFATPVNVLADEFLTLQVLAPSAEVRGRIAYEVPADLSGAWYWIPGASSRRILLSLRPTAVADTATSGAATSMAPAAPTEQPPPPASARVAAAPTPPVETPAAPAPAASAPTIRAPGSESATPARVAMTDATSASTPARSEPAPTPADVGGRGGVATTSNQSSAVVNIRNEQARTLACQALVARNDPSEKARYLGFFARECDDYPMPTRWRPGQSARITPPPVPSSAPTWPPRPGPSFDCDQAVTRAEHLVCEDAVLSLMDWELARAYNSARGAVADPIALQREQDAWRYNVRDACTGVSCLQSAYGERTARLEAIARGR